MRHSRRTVLTGLGLLAIGRGGLFGTGAFSSGRADRTVTVETAGDAQAFLRLEPTPGSPSAVFATDPKADGENTIEITLDESDAEGLNEGAVTQIEKIVTVWNNGPKPIDEFYFEFDVDATETNQDAADVEAALGVVLFSFTNVDEADDETGIVIDDADGTQNVLEWGVATAVEDNSHEIMGPPGDCEDDDGNEDRIECGDRFDWGLYVDLGPESAIDTLPADLDIRLRITVQTADDQ